MKLTDAFERVYILNLPFKTDRRERLTNHLDELGLVDWTKVKWMRATCGDWTRHPGWWSAGNGAWGCLLSHLRVVEEAIHDGLSNFLVLEDDVVFHANAREMLAGFMSWVPSDWGQLYLGGQYLNHEPEIVPDTDGKVMRPFNVNRTHAFALHSRIFQRFMCHILHAPDYMDYEVADDGMPKLCGNEFHIDHQLGRAHERRDWDVYSPKWWIAGQEAGSSNVSGKTNPRFWWHWRSWGEKLPFVVVKDGETLPEGWKDKLHFGNNLIPSTYRDKGMQRALANPLELPDLLKLLAGEAIEQWRLPAVSLRDGEQAKIASLWPAGIVTDPSEAWDYPTKFNPWQ